MSNAIKFTSHGEIIISSYTTTTHVVVSVKDSGIGIPEKVASTLFRASSSSIGTNNEKGSGIGLLLCKDLAVKNGGDVWLASTAPEEGSDFRFSFQRG